jgi:hypothetical protein
MLILYFDLVDGLIMQAWLNQLGFWLMEISTDDNEVEGVYTRTELEGQLQRNAVHWAFDRGNGRKGDGIQRAIYSGSV